MSTLPISVAIPTFNRSKELLYTITQIQKCNPRPQEIIVHIDAGDNQAESVLSQVFPEVIIIRSDKNIGPGGGRNKCIQIAKNNLVASFDDDSFPIDSDYFSELLSTSLQYPMAIIIEAKIYHLNEEIEKRERKIYEQHNFTGCGCAYHKNIFLQTDGYVPKSIAYGLEEVDLSLKAYQQQLPIIHNTQLRVLHNTVLSHHVSYKINAAAITNRALLAYLRYPLSLYFKGFLQTANRVWWSIKNNRFKGILKGIYDIPISLFKFRHYRKTIPATIIRQFLLNRAKRKLIS